MTFSRRPGSCRNLIRVLGFGILMGVLGTSVMGDDAVSVTLSGKARRLGSVLKERGITADAALIGDQVVLELSDGSLAPLLPNGASKALFLDERLRNRSAEVKAWRHPGLPYLEVVSVRVEENGRLRTPEYFCEICTISVRYPQTCPCCQGSMELRYQPATED